MTTIRWVTPFVTIISLISSVLLPGATTAALEAGTPSPVVADSPLIVSAYFSQALRSESGITKATQPAYVELYNNSDSVQPIAGYSLTVEWNPSSRVQEVRLGEDTNVYVPPKQHIVIDMSGTITGASLQVQGFDAEVGEYLNTVSLDNRAGFNPYTIAVADSQYKDKTTQPLRQQLTPTTTGYTSTGKYITDTRASLYDQGLYTPRQSFMSGIPIEILANPRTCGPSETDAACADYIKWYNAGTEPVDFSGTRLRIGTRGQAATSANTIVLSGILNPGEYRLLTSLASGTPLSLTNTGSFVWLEDMYGIMRYDSTTVEYPDASATAHKGQSWALSDQGGWGWAMPQPNGPNQLITAQVATEPSGGAQVACKADQFRNPETGRCKKIEADTVTVCASDQFVNPETGRCKKVAAATSLASCDVDEYRSPDTNRCRKLTSAAATLVACKEGQERNVETNRCRSVTQATSELKPCEAGQERNPETNRCRKSTGAGVTTTAGFKVEPTGASTDTLAAWWAMALLGVGALGYAAWEWRVEILHVLRRLKSLFTRTPA